MKEKLVHILENLNANLVGKEQCIKLVLLSVLAQENIILLGPPGTAKSEISRRISKLIDKNLYFEYLLTKFTTPEEIFGPLSISDLKEDRFHRKTEGYLPKAGVVFLDEIFKANSSILNSLLSLMNEKIFHNGKEKEEAPLLAFIGASNEDPSENPDLAALYDRFLLKEVVHYLKEEDWQKLFQVEEEPFQLPSDCVIQVEELKKIEEEQRKISIPEEIQELLIQIRRENPEAISDRKMVKILGLLRVSAYCNGREEVDLSDLLLLQNCLWTAAEHRGQSKEILLENILDFLDQKEEELSSSLKGSGSKEDPFLIEDEVDLLLVEEKDLLDKGYYFKQVRDIPMSPAWRALGSSKKPFRGHYDGNGKIISQLRGNLFEVLEEASLHNIQVKEARIDQPEEMMGVLANLASSSEISYCSVEGSLSAKHHAAGILAFNRGDCYIHHCRVKAEISSTWSNGGILAFSAGNCEIRNCEVEGKLSSDFYAGGILAYNSSEAKIANCFVSASVFGIASSAGILGYDACTAEISCCITKGKVFSEATAGGILGEHEGGSQITNCLVRGEISSTDFSSALAIDLKKNDKQAKNNYLSTEAKLKGRRKSSEGYSSISPRLLQKKFFEVHGYDFTKDWAWNYREGKISLRFPLWEEREAPEDLKALLLRRCSQRERLTQLLENNIWI